MTHHPDFSTYLQLVSFLVRAAQFTFQHYNFWNKYPLLTKFEVHTGGYGLHKQRKQGFVTSRMDLKFG